MFWDVLVAVVVSTCPVLPDFGAGVSLDYKSSPHLNPCPRKENTSGLPGILGVEVHS